MKIAELLSVSEVQVEEFRELFAELNPSITVSKEKVVKAIESPRTHVFVVLDDDEHKDQGTVLRSVLGNLGRGDSY